MPHVDIKCFPRDMNEEEKKALATDIAEVISRHLGSKDRAISIALQEINDTDWKTEVWDVEIAPHLEELIKKPGYSM